jgi:16S rRNA (cytosine967-C5)-methyltransferase
MINVVPRDLAIQLLTQVFNDYTSLDSGFEQVVSAHPTLDAQSRAWLRDVCSGVLRWRGRLEAAVDSTALKKKPSGWLRKALLVASYQLILQERVPAAVVVNETVSLVKSKEGELPAKFANACLRKIADSASAWKSQAFPAKGSLLDQSRWASVPEWFWQKLIAQRGVEWAERFARASYDRPEIWIRAHSEEGAKLGEAGPVEGSYRLTQGGMISDQEGFSEGLFFVQDISSQLLISEVTKRLRVAMPDFARKPITVLDLCAAPGGKSMGLAWNSFHVTATDQDANRLKLISQNLARLADAIASAGGRIFVVDRAKVAPLPPQDLVWVDAPCSGSGIIRRHPDVRWLRQEKDFHALRSTQDALLREAWEKTRPGGFLVYSVCSIFEDEGAGAVKRAGLSPYIQKDWLLSPDQPPYGDGFWAALIEKPTA